MIKYRSFAEDIAKRAGVVIREHFGLGMSKSWKSDNSPVTKTDLMVNTMLLDKVQQHFPSHRVLAEEESRMEGESEYVWVCDPVDGTIPFSHGVPLCTFSLALTKNGESILGVVYDPFGDRLFIAEKGQGAYLNGSRLRVSERGELKGAVADCEGFAAAHYDISQFTDRLMLKEGVIAMVLCSFIYPSVLVAVGEFAFTVFSHTTAHDVAAVKIIVEEAGGKVTDLFGEEQRYDRPGRGLIASNGVLHDRLVALARETVKDRYTH